MSSPLFCPQNVYFFNFHTVLASLTKLSPPPDPPRSTQFGKPYTHILFFYAFFNIRSSEKSPQNTYKIIEKYKMRKSFEKTCSEAVSIFPTIKILHHHSSIILCILETSRGMIQLAPQMCLSLYQCLVFH